MIASALRLHSLKTLAAVLGLSALTALSACGGGGGGGGGSGGGGTMAYTLGGSVSGLNASGLVLANGSTTLSVASGATTFSFPTALASGSTYTVTVQTQPTGQTCSVADGSGTLSGNVSNIVVTCAAQTYTVGGTITGLGTATGLVLANGTDTVTVPASATTFTLPTPVATGASYQVTVKTQPSGLMCVVSPSTAATMGSANVTNVAVSCSTSTFTIGGTVTVTGAAAGAAVADAGMVIKNTTNGDTYTFAANATSFTLPTAVAYGAAYALTVSTQPTGLTCAVASATGTAQANVSVSVVCSTQAFPISGAVTLSAPAGTSTTNLSDAGLVLTDSTNNDTYTFTTNGTAFTFPMAVPYGAAYAITVTTQPPGLMCSVANGSGTMPASAVTGVAVTCSDQSFTLGGTITGLTGAGLVLSYNGTTFPAIAANATAFTVPTQVPYGASYAVTVQQNPAGLVCTAGANTGTMPSADTNTVTVACTPQVNTALYSFGGSSAAPPDGADPYYSSLVLGSDGNFYGTTAYGGANAGGAVSGVPPGGGTLFQYNPTTKVETVLHSFGGPNSDGTYPNGVVQVGQALYVVALNGGANSSGAVMQFPLGATPSNGTLVHSFGSVAGDGTFPLGTVTVGTDGNLYGMTRTGGANNKGAIYEINPANAAYSVLYSFGASPADATYPQGNLLQASDGNFYGVSDTGGANNNAASDPGTNTPPNNSGTIFKYVPGAGGTPGTVSVLYSFGGTVTGVTDGFNPTGTLVQASDGNLYGTTVNGGANGKGVLFVYRVSAGTYGLLHSFAGGVGGSSDGANAYGALIQASDGNLYGLSYGGGASGDGTVFEYNYVQAASSGTDTESVRYSFLGTDGANPYGALVQDSSGNFYGVTSSGGANTFGVIFELN